MSGIFFRTDFFIIQSKKTSFEHFRVGFTASKKVGNAVIRNKCKRRMRALADLLLPTLGLPKVDYVFIAKPQLYFAAWHELLQKATFAIQSINKKINK